MKTLIYILLLLFVLTSCKKNKFTSCASYDALVGEWLSIDEENGTKDIVKLSKNGLYEYISAFGRGTKKRMVLCKENEYSTQWPSWKFISLYSNENSVEGATGRSIRYTADFDSIAVSVGDYNGNNGSNLKRFVRN